jgi:tRNA(fMet)-specific endonuclease VapC
VTRLLLDTSVLVDHERSGRLLDLIPHDADLAIAAISLAELATGVELASDRHRAARAAYVAELGRLPIVVYDEDVAAVHGQLLADTRRRGRPRGAHDLIIAASSIATARSVVTSDAGGFADLPGLDVLLLEDR